MSSIAVVLLVLAPYAAAAQERPRVPQGPTGTVTLPVADYDRLVDRAQQPERRPDPPPVDAVVGRADVRARVAADVVRGTVRLDGEVFKRGHVKIALVAGATLIEARADGRPLPLLHEGNTHAAILPGPSPFSIALDWAAPVTAAPGRASFALPVPAGGSVSITLDLPGDPADVRVEPGLVTRRQAVNGRTTIEATLEPGRGAQVSWSAREAAAAPVESRILSDVRSLVSIGEADLRMVSLVDVTVVAGEPRSFEIRLPAGFELTGVTGSSIESTDQRGSAIAVTVREPSRRRHQFLVSLEQAHAPGSFKADTSFPTVPGAQREVGETAIEGGGAIEVIAAGDEGMRRMDVRETNPSLRSLARQPLLAAFRYQRRPQETRLLTLDVKRFADAPVIAAAAERAVATTLVTGEGRTLTELSIWLRNRAQPFMKVTLPAGATMLSVDVAGEPAKPVTGADGVRVPLLRPGFRPDGPYMISFVYLHAGKAFEKRGDAQMSLPRFDVPVSVLEWELFLPERFKVKPDGGNVIPGRLVDANAPVTVTGYGTGSGPGSGGATGGGTYRAGGAVPGQIVGRITDETGDVLPGATVVATGAGGVRQSTVTDANGMYAFFGVPSGRVTVSSELPGFVTAQRSLDFDQRPRLVDFRMRIGAITETVQVTAEAPIIDTRTSERGATFRTPAPPPSPAQPGAEDVQQAPSQNVLNLQRRVAGVLPVRIDVPRSGMSYRFMRPLVVDEETTVSFRYKTR